MKITYSKIWNDYSHNGGLITDLKKFIATALALGMTIEFVVDTET